MTTDEVNGSATNGVEELKNGVEELKINGKANGVEKPAANGVEKPADTEADAPKTEGEETAKPKDEVEDDKPKEPVVTTKYLEERYDEKGHKEILEAGSGPPAKAKTDKWAHYILCYTRHFNQENKQWKSSIEINSPHVKEILRRLIKNYPGESFATERIILDLPSQALFHYRDELYAELEALEDGEAKDHLRHVLTWYDDEEEEIIRGYKNLIGENLTTFEHIWTIFKPGCTIYSNINGHDRAFLLKKGYPAKSPAGPVYALDCLYTDYDGKIFGTRESRVTVSFFSGSASISSLEAFPIQFHPKQKQVEQALISRGRLFESYKGKTYCQYSGIALGEWVNCRRVKYNIQGRVMVDCETFSRIETDRSISVSRFKKDTEDPDIDYDSDNDYWSDDEDDLDAEGKKRVEQPPLTDTQCMHATNLCAGFAFTEKKWVEYYVTKLSPIEWNDKAFDHLVLPPAQKALVRALVESHVRESEHGGFDDVIKGKGKGLISILHGEPGVGKTLTAESVAEFTRRPLYMVSSGELGTYSARLEENLAQILDVATVWKAVVLIDEADVFCEKRSLHDLERNSLVSIFLRLLEYYQGILFLTTNRVTSFDEAFQSRIHVALKYNALEASARRTVWKNFLGKMENVDVDEAGYDALEKRALNGRQIKNAVKTAKSLADSQGIKVDRRQIESVLDIQRDFERDLKEAQDAFPSIYN